VICRLRPSAVEDAVYCRRLDLLCRCAFASCTKWRQCFDNRLSWRLYWNIESIAKHSRRRKSIADCYRRPEWDSVFDVWLCDCYNDGLSSSRSSKCDERSANSSLIVHVLCTWCPVWGNYLVVSFLKASGRRDLRLVPAGSRTINNSAVWRRWREMSPDHCQCKRHPVTATTIHPRHTIECNVIEYCLLVRFLIASLYLSEFATMRGWRLFILIHYMRCIYWLRLML